MKFSHNTAMVETLAELDARYEREREEEARLQRLEAASRFNQEVKPEGFLEFILAFIRALFNNELTPPDFEDAPSEEARAAARIAYEARMAQNPPTEAESSFSMSARMLSYASHWEALKSKYEAIPIPSLPVADEARFTSAFASRINVITRNGTEDHKGIDLAPETPGTKGVPILSAMPGVVIQVVHERNSGGFGNLVRVAGIDGRIYEYAHLDKINVNEGDSLEQGNRIGTMGNTGRSTGVHLHYGILQRDDSGKFVYVNPDINGQILTADLVRKKQFVAAVEVPKDPSLSASIAQQSENIGHGLSAQLTTSNSPFRS